MRVLLRPFKRLRREEDGNAVIEFMFSIMLFVAALALPLTAYGYYVEYVRGQKATYAIADSISRQETAITPQFLTSMVRLYQEMAGQKNDLGYRISVVDWNPRKKKYRVRWMRQRFRAGLDDVTRGRPTQQFLKETLPPLADNEAIILVETWVTHEPLYNVVGLKKTTFELIALARPRNAPQICVTTESDPFTTNRRC